MTTDTTAADSVEPERHSFEAEVSRLLHLMVHAVYSDRDIFLRELISNAADACEKLRYLSIETPALLGEDAAFRVLIEADAAAGTLTVDDNGIGMSRDELKDNLGTIARSGTRAFLDGLAERKDGGNLIGQFGVGFYSAFMVAGEVVVQSRRAGSDEAFEWRSDGKGTFALRALTLDEAPARGTRVTLHLLDDAKDYAERATIERVVRAYSTHVAVPIRLKADGEERQLADGSALWMKPKASVTPEEYREFYGSVGGFFDEPAVTVHFRAEGRTEYSALLFVPSMKPFDLFDPERRGKVKLYVRRVFITDEAPILPPFLRFVRGVIDSEDLPLNISREMLQKNPLLDAIGKGVTSRVLSELKKLADSDGDTFEAVWDAFGPVLKEGLYEAPDRRDDLFAIARFRSVASGEGRIALADYVKGMKENQTAIYYVLADSPEAALASPHLEGYRARGLDVLLLTDPVDAFWVRTAVGFDGKPFRSVTQGGAELDAIPLAEPEAETPAAEVSDIAALAQRFKEALAGAVSEVRPSARLATSAVCLVAPEHGPDKQFEKILARSDGKGAGTAPILEINPRNGLIAALAARLREGRGEALDDAAWLLLGQASILDGEAPEQPAEFARRLSALMDRAYAAG